MRLYLTRILTILCVLISPLAARAMGTPLITVSPGYTTIGVNTSLQYTAAVTGLSNTAVTWYVNGVAGGNATVGTISSTGLYHSPVTVPAASSILVTALGSDRVSAGYQYVNVAPVGPAISSISPNPIQVGNYTITVTGSGFIKGASVTDGTYILSTTVVNSTTITATGYQATIGTGSFQVTNPGTMPGPAFPVQFVGQTVSPSSLSLVYGGTQQFTSPGATLWSATAGTVSSNGLYKAPATMPRTGTTVTVTATGPLGSASATVTLVPPQAISPTTTSLMLGATQQFTGANATSWTATAGTITSTGLYTAPSTMPSGGTATVTASGPGGSASAAITLFAPLTISPTSVSVVLGKTQQFTSVGATSWTATAGTVSSSGLYTAPSTMPSGSNATVTASGPTGTASAVVTLLPSVTISPTSATVVLGGTQQFTSTGATSFTATVGTITSTGLYTAPAKSGDVSVDTATITATGPGGSASAIVTLSAPTTLTISPATATVAVGSTQQFTSASATSWSATAGTISSTGLYTAPATLPSNTSVKITATGANGSATAAVTLVSATAALTISPLSVSVKLGQTQQFTANGATSWTASAGTVTSTGLFTAPAALPAVTTVTVTASGSNGSATATVLLISTSTGSASTGSVSITTENPYYGWDVIPGATRRIHAQVTNGSTNEVTWSYTTAGGATATITPAPAPNVLGAFVDVTVGSVGSACKNVGTDTNPVLQSSASVTLTATSVDDPTQSVQVPIQVCNPQVQAFVSPFNVRLYSGQSVDLQSWVWGAVNDNVTWAVTKQPSGGNGAFIAPPAGGSANTSRDALFSATVAGDYTVTATSVANPSVSASAVVSVDSAAMPSYAVTPNHTEPVDCSVDPTQSGTTYDIGPGHPYASLAAAYAAIGSNVLKPGTTLRLFNTDTTGVNPTHYHEYLRLDGYGTETAPIRLVGCADSAGNLPVLDGANATAYSPTDDSAAAGLAGLYQVAIHHNGGSFAVYPTIVAPSYIIIEGLAFRNAYSTLGSTNNYFYAPGSSTQTQWSNQSSCIRPYEGNHVTVRGNDVQDCGWGILGDFNGNNGWGGFFGDFDLQGNYFNNNGTSGFYEHMAYVQGYRQIIQGNVFDQLKSVSGGVDLKMRGVAEVVRYNQFNSSTNTRTVDFVEEQDSNMYMSFLGYYYTPSGSVSFHNEYPNDAYTPDMLAAADEAWHKAYIYGNIFNGGPNALVSPAAVHFFGDQGPYSDQNLNPPVRVGDLFDYSNTFYSVGGASLYLVDTQQNLDDQIRWEWPQLTLWNNAMWVGPLNNSGYQGFEMSTLRSDFYTLGPNWLSSNWGTNNQTCSNNSGGACIGTGWPYQMESTQYMDGSNLPAHITGLSNLITGGSTLPFSLTTWAATSGGGLVGAGAALPSSLTNMPVRLQMSGYSLKPRTSPLTLGAHD